MCVCVCACVYRKATKRARVASKAWGWCFERLKYCFEWAASLQEKGPALLGLFVGLVCISRCRDVFLRASWFLTRTLALAHPNNTRIQIRHHHPAPTTCITLPPPLKKTIHSTATLLFSLSPLSLCLPPSSSSHIVMKAHLNKQRQAFPPFIPLNLPDTCTLSHLLLHPLQGMCI